MKMINIKAIIFLIALVLNYSQGFSQPQVLSRVSIQGTWDKIKDVKRARFAGNNLILNKQFQDQFSSQFGSRFALMTMRKGISINVTGELTFRINGANIDSITVIKSSGYSAVDSVMTSLLQSTSGKWIAGKVDGNVVKEEIRIWIHIFSGYVDFKPNTSDILKGDKYFAKGDYKNAIEAYDKVINRDELDINAITKKGQALIKIDKAVDACSLWKSYEKYETLEIPKLLKENCEQ